MKTSFIFIFAACTAGIIAVSACERPIDIDINETDPVVVFEGWINDKDSDFEISISKTANYFGDEPVPQVSGAFVTITDELGNTDTLQETAPGKYRSTGMDGQQLRTYSFRAEVEGEVYEATSYLPRINQIDTLVQVHEDGSEFLEEGEYVVLVAQEPAGVGDYYWFRFYKNDSLYDGPGDFWFTDDRFADGQLALFQYPNKLEPGDTAVAEIYSITKEAYDYLFTLLQQSTGGGGPFGAPPDNIKGNLSNGALGYLGAVGVARDTIIIQ